MNAVNAVLLFILVCFTAVCQAEDISVICDDVTGSVGTEVNLTCRVSLQNTDCYIEKYVFLYPESFSDSPICRKEFPNGSCTQRNSFSCSYTPTTATTQLFTFFLQTTRGVKRTKFTLNITERALDEKLSGTSAPDTAAGHGSRFSVIAVVLGCFILIILIIMTIIRYKKPNFNRSCGFQKRMFLCIRPDEDNSTRPEDVI